MKMKITCRCGAAFELYSGPYSKGPKENPIVCQSCGAVVPEKVATHIHNCLRESRLMDEELKHESLYLVEVTQC